MNGDDTFATLYQRRRHTRAIESISANRSNLSTAIDTISDLGIALNDYCSVTTHKCRVAMCLYASTGTECGTYRHCRVLIHSADFTAAIDITTNSTVTDSDTRCPHHGSLTLEGIIMTLTGTEDMTRYHATSDSNCTKTCVLCPCVFLMVRSSKHTHIA